LMPANYYSSLNRFCIHFSSQCDTEQKGYFVSINIKLIKGLRNHSQFYLLPAGQI
jgi:hypothetical protein